MVCYLSLNVNLVAGRNLCLHFQFEHLYKRLHFGLWSRMQHCVLKIALLFVGVKYIAKCGESDILKIVGWMESPIKK